MPRTWCWETREDGTLERRNGPSIESRTHLGTEHMIFEVVESNTRLGASGEARSRPRRATTRTWAFLANPWS